MTAKEKEDSNIFKIKKNSPILAGIIILLLGSCLGFMVYEFGEVDKNGDMIKIHDHRIKTNTENHNALMDENRFDHIEIKKDMRKVIEILADIKGQLKYKRDPFNSGKCETIDYDDVSIASNVDECELDNLCNKEKKR